MAILKVLIVAGLPIRSVLPTLMEIVVGILTLKKTDRHPTISMRLIQLATVKLAINELLLSIEG